MKVTRTEFFQDSRGNLGNRINEFISEQEKKDKNFSLIDIKLSMGSHKMDEYSYVSAMVIYSCDLHDNFSNANKETKIQATFRGLDGSCDYRKNQEYVLSITHRTLTEIVIKNKDGGGYCEYGSMISFLDNWDNIKKI